MEHKKEIEVPVRDPKDLTSWVTDEPTSADVRRRMVKPEIRIGPPSNQDQSVVERVARGMQDSLLHVFGFLSSAAHPDHPERDDISISMHLAAVTDAKRGFLVLTDDFAPPRSDSELLGFMQSAYNGCEGDKAFATRIARIYDGPYCRKHGHNLLDLRDVSAVQQVVEMAYEDTFAGKDEIDHGAFVRSLTRFRHSFEDELAVREFYKMLDDCFGPAPSSP